MQRAIPAISPRELSRRVATPDAPVLLDVRRREAYEASPHVIPGARWRDHRHVNEWARDLPAGAPVVVYCVHGHQVSRSAVVALESAGVEVACLTGGIEAYAGAGGVTAGRAALEAIGPARPSAWLLPRPAGLGAAACAWLVRRFLDREARLHFAGGEWSAAIAEELGALPIGFPSTALGSPAALSRHLEIDDPPLDRLTAAIADTHAAALSPVFDGLGRIAPSPHALVERASHLFDGLYAHLRAPERA